MSSITGSGITATNNKIKDIIKVIRSLENFTERNYRKNYQPRRRISQIS